MSRTTYLAGMREMQWEGYCKGTKGGIRTSEECGLVRTASRRAYIYLKSSVQLSKSLSSATFVGMRYPHSLVKALLYYSELVFDVVTFYKEFGEFSMTEYAL